jgi:hypothetical protein
VRRLVLVALLLVAAGCDDASSTSGDVTTITTTVDECQVDREGVVEALEIIESKLAEVEGQLDDAGSELSAAQDYFKRGQFRWGMDSLETGGSQVGDARDDIAAYRDALKSAINSAEGGC